MKQIPCEYEISVYCKRDANNSVQMLAPRCCVFFRQEDVQGPKCCKYGLKTIFLLQNAANSVRMRDFRSKMEQITYFSSKRANNKEKCAKLKNKTKNNNCAQK